MATLQEQIAQHVADLDNPHKVTKSQLGLSGIENYPIATQAQALAGDIDNLYLTPARLQDLFDGILQRENLIDANRNVIYQ